MESNTNTIEPQTFLHFVTPKAPTTMIKAASVRIWPGSQDYRPIGTKFRRTIRE